MTTIIVPQDLADFLRSTVDSASATTAIRLAEGWLVSATKLSPWPPDPVPEDIWAWALELAAIAYANPQGVSTSTTGGETTQWMARVDRQTEILEAAQRIYGGQGRPSGQFPRAKRWPEPADRYSHVGRWPHV